MVVYPTAGYNSFTSTAAANTFFDERLNSDEWFAPGADVTAALVTAFRSICELDVTIDLTDSVQLQAITEAQLEQALHELKNDTDGAALSYLSMADIQLKREKAPRYSERALAILRPYMTARTISMVR